MLKDRHIGIDLGTVNVYIFMKGKGIVLKEPSVVAINKETNKILAIGEEARKMVGKTPGSIITKRPMRDGVIADYNTTEKMLEYFIKKIWGRRRFSKPKVIVGIPSGGTEVEKRAVIEASLQAGAKEAFLVEEPMAAALGAGIDVGEPNGNMVVDIGGGTTDIAIIS
ncbi:MAG TPA: rod shape-determining protein, partial [Candidatus Atribacteria bacterium]|nr:rod shape-determining protein [Candidatus Atribacteria bacterium]